MICSGQAVVLHKLAIMSKDGDWILKEDSEALNHVLDVLAQKKATYRFGAPLDIAWLEHGWSSHFEFQENGLRIRTDFFTRPPRISRNMLDALWKEQESKNPPFVGLSDLAMMKLTNREKDYVVLGELARRMSSPVQQITFSRSARDLLELRVAYPEVWKEMLPKRPCLARASEGAQALAAALDAEKRELIAINEARLDRYAQAATNWAGRWRDLSQGLRGMDLKSAHALIKTSAEGVLPYAV